MDHIIKENLDLKIKLVTEFQTFENGLNGQASDNIHMIRQDALSIFNEIGFPEKRSEEWKYTNINPATRKDYKTAIVEEAGTLKKENIEEFLIDDLRVNLIVLVNGRFEHSLSNIISDMNDCFIGNLSDGKEKHPDIFEKHFAKYADYKNNGMTALNTAFAKDGLLVYVPKGKAIEEPVHLLNISTGLTDGYFSQPRNLIIVEESGSFNLIEDSRTLGDNDCFSNSVTEIFVGQNATMEHYKIQNDGKNSFSVNTTEVHQERDSHYNNVTISWGGKIIRNDLNSTFDGENTECHFFGLYLLTGKEHVDNHTLADHKMPNCFSNELYKGIITDKATGVFNGKIMVREDAQKTNAYQSNNTILLSDEATMNAKPQLEIFADDVKCSHGATTGQLNKDEMFYLRARGISEDDARILLLYAFANGVIEPVKIEKLKERLFNQLKKKLQEVR